MALTPVQEVTFDPDEPGPAHQQVTSAMETPGGWLNLTPVPEPGEEPPPRNLFVSIFSSRGPELPLATVSRDQKEGPTIKVGLQHPGGPKAVDRLARDGLGLPPGWLVVSDHPRRGLVLSAPSTDAELAVDWLLEAAERLTMTPLPSRWAARRYQP
jgi:hypothetical protein